MNPFFTLPSIFREVKCPRCKQNQMVTILTLKKGFNCKFCGNRITDKNSK